MTIEERSGMVKAVFNQELPSGSHDMAELLGCSSPEWELPLTHGENNSDVDLLST